VTVLLFFALSIAVPFLVHRFSEYRLVSLPVIAAWVIASYSGARLAFVCVSGQKRILSLTFWVFTYVWMGLAPLFQFAAADLPLPGSYSSGDALLAYAALAVGLVGFELSFAASKRRSSQGVSAFERMILSRTVVPGRLVVASVVSVLAIVTLVFQLGGWSTLLASRGDLVARTLELVQAEGVAYFLIFTSALRVPICVVFFLSLYIWKHRATLLPQSTRPWFTVMLAVITGLNLFVNNPVNAPRYWTGTIVLGSLFILLPSRSRYLLTAATFLLLAAVILVFPHADVFRTEVDPGAIGEITWSMELQRGDFDAFQQLMNALLYVDHNGVSFGRQLAGALCFFVPRSLWPNKPLSSGQLVAVDSGYFYTNLSMPLWGEAYLDGSYFAVIVVFAIYGWFLGRTERLYLQERFVNGTMGGVGVPIFAAYQLFLLRGALMSGIAYLVPIVVMLTVCTKAAETRTAAPAPGLK